MKPWCWAETESAGWRGNRQGLESDCGGPCSSGNRWGLASTVLTPVSILASQALTVPHQTLLTVL